MDEGTTLLVTLVMIVVVVAILTTGVHIVKPGEIGFVYRGRKFLRHSGPAFLMGPPIISKIYRMKAESLHIVFESSSPRTEVLLGIADPSRVPVTVEGLDSEIRNLSSKTIKEVLSRRKAGGNGTDLEVVAEEMRLGLNKSFENMGLSVNSVKVGDRHFGSPISESAGAKIPSWDDVSRKLGS